MGNHRSSMPLLLLIAALLTACGPDSADSGDGDADTGLDASDGGSDASTDIERDANLGDGDERDSGRDVDVIEDAQSDAEEDVTADAITDADTTEDAGTEDATDAVDTSDASGDDVRDASGDAVVCRDFDHDAVCDVFDNCAANFNPDQADVDEDGDGDVCDVAPGTPGDAPADGMAVVGDPGMDALELTWNDEIAVRIPGPLAADTYTLIVEPDLGESEHARYTLYRSGDADAALDNSAAVSVAIANEVSDAMTAVRFASSTLRLNLDGDGDGSGTETELSRCELDVAPCATTSGVDADENGVPEKWNVFGELVRTGAIVLYGGLPADPVPDVVTPADWIEVGALVGDGDPDMVAAEWDEAVNARQAWLASTGGPLVAVIGDGFDSTNSDVPFVGGSGDGVLINGQDFVDGDLDSSVVGPTVGTAVASVIAAELDGAGINGVAFSSDILAIRGMGGTISQMASAIVYAVDEGAKVVVVVGGTDTFVTSLQDAVDYALAHDVLVVASAGGYGGAVPADRLRYPAAFDSALAVAGLDLDGTLYSGSRYGSWVDIAAPAVGVVNSVPDIFVSNTGTHFAAALVGGAAALYWSVHPDRSAEDVRNALIASGSPLFGSAGVGGFPALDIGNAVLGSRFDSGSIWLTNDGCDFGAGDFLDEATLLGLGATDDGVLACTTGELAGEDQGRAVLPIRISADVDWHLEASVAFCTEETLRWPGAGYEDIGQISTSSGGLGRPTMLFRGSTGTIGTWTTVDLGGRLIHCSDFETVTSSVYTLLSEGISVTALDGGDTIGETWLLIDDFEIVPE